MESYIGTVVIFIVLFIIFRQEKKYIIKKQGCGYMRYNINSEEDIWDLEEELIIAGLTKVKEKYGEIIKTMFNEDVIVPTRPFPRIKLNDLYKELEKRYGYNNRRSKNVWTFTCNNR